MWHSEQRSYACVRDRVSRAGGRPGTWSELGLNRQNEKVRSNRTGPKSLFRVASTRGQSGTSVHKKEKARKTNRLQVNSRKLRPPLKHHPTSPHPIPSLKH